MKVRLIVLDGATGKAIYALASLGMIPNITKLISNSTYSFDSVNTNNVTDTGSGLATICSGVRNIIPNNYAGLPRQPITPEFLEQVQIAVNQRLISKPYFFQHLPSELDCIYIGGANEYLLIDHLSNTYNLTSYLNNLDLNRMTTMKNVMINFDCIYLHLSGVDKAGHNYGGHLLRNSRYVQELMKADTWIGEMMNLDDWENEDIHYILTSDHGGDAKGHGSKHYDHRDTYYIHAHNSFSPSEIKAEETISAHTRVLNYYNVPHNEDIAPTILELFNVQKPTYMTGKIISPSQNRTSSEDYAVQAQDSDGIFC